MAEAQPEPWPVIHLNHENNIYQEGEDVIARIDLPQGIGSAFLYVAYPDPIGTVTHLIPSADRDSAVEYGQQLPLTAGRVVPPFGQGCILAILSPTLLPGLVGTTDQSLDRYRQILSRVLTYARTRGQVLAAAVPLETAPRQR